MAALISGGIGVIGIAGTVVTSVVGSKDTRRATERAITTGADNTRATLAAAREDRLWERRCAAYEETLAELLFRQDRRLWEQFGGNPFRGPVGGKSDSRAAQELRDAYAEYDSTTWFERQGRLSAYSSDAVHAASKAAVSADVEARVLANKVAQLAKQASGLPPIAPEHEALRKITEISSSAEEAVRAADGALIKVIRDELRSKPEAAIAPPALPAVRRRFRKGTS